MKKITTEFIYGIHPLIELLKAKKRKLFKVYTTKPEPKAFKQIQHLLPKYPVEIVYKKKQELNNLVDTTDHQGIVALVSPLQIRKKPFDPKKQATHEHATHEHATPEQASPEHALPEQKAILLLDGIQDTRNLGAIIRSAYCTGFQGIVIPKKGSAPLNASTYKASAGLIEHIEIYQPPSTAAAVNELKKAGYNLYISALTKKAENATTITYKKPLCLVIGSEGTGVQKDILNKGQAIIIPQKQSDISYNASVAAGILMFFIATQNKLL